ncbi:MAG: DUF2892 domain-containing protein [Candidatus Micrarchaeota archaeon]|nr:DUF2892 domain-containing protein [Candidatus Micrarchaeota archaeon]
MRLSKEAAELLDLLVSVLLGTLLVWAAKGTYFPYPMNVAIGIFGLLFLATAFMDSTWLFRILGVRIEGEEEKGGEKMLKIGEKNVGTLDRAVRIALGAVALYLFGANSLEAPLSYIALVAGVALLVSGVWGSCVLYSLLKINTAKK